MIGRPGAIFLMRRLEIGDAARAFDRDHLGAVDRAAAAQANHAIMRTLGQERAAGLNRGDGGIGDHPGERAADHARCAKQVLDALEQA